MGFLGVFWGFCGDSCDFVGRVGVCVVRIGLLG